MLLQLFLNIWSRQNFLKLLTLFPRTKYRSRRTEIEQRRSVGHSEFFRSDHHGSAAQHRRARGRAVGCRPAARARAERWYLK